MRMFVYMPVYVYLNFEFDMNIMAKQEMTV